MKEKQERQSTQKIVAKFKGKGKSHIRSVRWGVPVKEDPCPEPSAFEVGWPVPFLAAFIFPVFPPGPHSLLSG